MPPSSGILAGLALIANAWTWLAVAWHIAAAGLLIALLAGWQPPRRTLGALLVLPLVSVAALAFANGNPFNGGLFAALAAGLLAMAARLSGSVPRAPLMMQAAGLALVAFGWIYPHFLEGSPWTYAVAAPLGLIPCPTLSAVIGFTLLRNGLGSRAWSLALGGMGLFYGLFGVLRLGVWLDAGLVAGALALFVAVYAPSRRPVHRA